MMPPKERSRNLFTKLAINGILVEATTIQGFADLLGKSRDTIIRYTRLGIFPQAFLRKGTYRYYPVSLAEKIKPIVDKFPTNRPPEQDLVVEITKAFNEEKQKLCQKQ